MISVTNSNKSELNCVTNVGTKGKSDSCSFFHGEIKFKKMLKSQYI